MTLSRQAIQSFQSLYRNAYGLDLTDNTAQTLALNFLHFFKLIYRPLPRLTEPMYECGDDK